MIYSLLLENGDSFELNGDSVTAELKQSLSMSDFALTKESNLIERSYGDGAAKVGSSRLPMNQITLILSLAFLDDADCRLYLNTLFAALKDAEYLVDETNAIRTRIDLSSPSIVWDEGGYFRSGDATIVLNQVVPYWEATVEQEIVVAIEAGVPTEASIINAGYAETPYVASIAVAEQTVAVEYVEIENIAEGRSLSLESASFGISGFELLELDCEEGTARLINEAYSTTLDVQDAFEAGAGYFNLTVGTNMLSLRCAVAATVTFTYRPRYFV